MQIGKLVGLFLITTLWVQPVFAEIGRVKRSTGVVSIERGNQRLKATPGLKLEAGDIMVTGKKSSVGITFVDNSRFAIGPGARVSVDRFNYDRTRQVGEFVTKVDRGSIAVVSGKIAKSKRDAMKVRTPTSLLGVRGTRFILEVP